MSRVYDARRGRNEFVRDKIRVDHAHRNEFRRNIRGGGEACVLPFEERAISVIVLVSTMRLFRAH